IAPVNVWCTLKERCKPECLTPPTLRGSSGSAMLWGAFCWHGLSQFIPLGKMITANLYKVLLDDHLCRVKKHFYPDGKMH
uniref:Uncharacterized protein n=1 Tax=Amphilophus citrinellus TaxID=61819 RepID=A0A3Q0SUG6_AMPCI